jgi:uroporphyrinogen-III synthase
MLIEKAAAKNIYIDTQTFIKTELTVSANDIRQIQSLNNKKSTVIFTSKNAVNAVVPYIAANTDWDIFCIGGVTKETALQFFDAGKIKASAKNASALAEKIVANKGITEVIFFCGDQRLNDLPDLLTQHHIAITEIVVYKTNETPHHIEKDYDAILFFSPSAVHSFFSANTVSTNILFFSIGKTTTTVIETYCSNTIITNEWPGKEQMVDLVINYFSNF